MASSPETKQSPTDIFKPVIQDGDLEAFFNSSSGSSSEGAELITWDEEYFIKNHMWKRKIGPPSEISHKTSCHKLISFFAGQNKIYKGILTDIKLAIFSMNSPSDMTELFFSELIDSNATKITASETEKTSLSNKEITPQSEYYAKTQQDGQEDDTSYQLADSVNAQDTTAPKKTQAPEIIEFNATTIAASWTELNNIILSMSDQGTPSLKARYVTSLIGLMCLHCFKLLTRNPNSVQLSMQTRLQKHFMDLYTPSEWDIPILPPCASSLMELKTIISSSNPDTMEILSGLIGKVILENVKPTPNVKVKGVLLGACLTHISMNGLAPVKQVEQTSSALSVHVGDFCKLICTSMTKTSLINVCHMFKLASTPIPKIKIFTEEYSLTSQTSWRYCRLYNPAHYSRFKTQNNIHIILRCAAYLAELQAGNQIENMTILSVPNNKKIYSKEKSRARRYLETLMENQDKPLTRAAQSVYGEEYSGEDQDRRDE